MRTYDEIASDAVRAEVERQLANLTEAQAARFRVFFPRWPDVSNESLRNALFLVQRTALKNESNAAKPQDIDHQ